MEQKNQTENKEYQFIREKVISKKKNRIKRMTLSFLFTIFLAAVFGVVARAVFLYSDGPMKRLFGLDEEPSATPGARGEHTKNTPSPVTTSTPAPVPTDNMSMTPSAGAETTATGTPAISVTPELTAAPTGSGESNFPGELVITDGDIAATGLPTPEPSFAERYGALFAGLQEVAREASRSLVMITVSVNGIDWLNNTYETQSQTTGIVIGKNELELLILVNLDRIQSASRISLTVEKENYAAELWSYDKDYNLAVVRVVSKGLPEHFLSETVPAVFGDSTQLPVGTPILALGNPNGYIGSMEFGTVTSRESIYYITDNSLDLFNTSTTDSDDGDGVIVNLSGEIVGIITRTMKSGFDEAMCTAVGISKLKSVIERLAAGQEQVYFGIRGEDIPKEALREQGLSNGIYVMEVATDSPAFEAGIKTGDIILQVDGKNIYSYSGFNTLLNLCTSGTEVRVTLWRTVRMNAEQMEVTVVLGGK